MSDARTLVPPTVGVEIVGWGSALPEKRLTNTDLEGMMDTSDEWIVQRTGIRERRMYDREGKGESTLTLSIESLKRALDVAGMSGDDLDLVIVATMTPEMSCPPTACRVASAITGRHIGAWDLSGACCGFVFALNNAHAMVRSGQYRSIAVIGADTLTRHMRYDNSGRDTAILFGDGAGAVIVRATDDDTRGLIAQSMRSNGEGWKDLYVPEHAQDIPEGQDVDESLFHTVRMNGRAVFKFAVGTFQNLIAETLEAGGIEAAEVSQFICHQSNARILSSARDRFGIPEDRMLVNIGRYGNTVAASVPLCFDELKQSDRVRKGDLVMFVAFGAGLTWASSLWRL